MGETASGHNDRPLRDGITSGDRAATDPGPWAKDYGAARTGSRYVPLDQELAPTSASLFRCDPRDPDRDVGELHLVALPTAVPCARAFSVAQLRKWRLGAYEESCELVASELVTNSVAATGGLNRAGNYVALRRRRLAPIILRLRLTRARIFCEVWDGSGDPPAPVADARTGDEPAEGGRGLVLVAAYATDWASYPSPAGGKVVLAWFDLGS